MEHPARYSHFEPLALAIARRLEHRARHGVDLEDLQQAARTALLEACASGAELTDDLFLRHAGKLILRACRACSVRRDTAYLPDVPDPRAGVDVEMERRQMATHLAGHIGFLPDAERQAINLRYDSGLKLRQISHEMGISKTRVIQILDSAILKLKGSCN